MSTYDPKASLNRIIAEARKGIIPPTKEGERPEIVAFENWPGVTFSEAGLVFGDNLDHETWIKLGRWLGGLNRKTRLWIADWITENDRRGWGHSYDELIIMTGLKRETLYNYASIGRRVPIQNRIAGPDTGLYEAVAVLPKHEQVPMLRRAIKNGWDRDRTRDAVKAYQANQEEAESGTDAGEVNLDDPPFAEEMQQIANLTPALGFEEKSGDTAVFHLTVPDSMVWGDDYYGALREILPEDVRVGEVWEIVARRRT